MNKNPTKQWNERRFYKLSLLLPVLFPIMLVMFVIPIAVIYAMVTGETVDSFLETDIGYVLLWITLTFVGGIILASFIYLLCVPIGLLITRNWSMFAFKLWGISLPIQLTGLSYALYGEAWLALGLLVGYFYVALAFAIGYFKKRYHLKHGTYVGG